MHSNQHYVKATFVIVIVSLLVLLMPLLASDYGDILAIFYPACIYSASRLSRSKNNKILIGFLYLIFYHIINLFWLYNTGSYVNVTLLLLILPAVYLLPVTVLVRSQFALFVLTWLAIDYIMLVWELGFPLLSIGHHLAFVPSLIFLGKWGGSLLINLLVLVSNLIVIRIIFTSGYKYKGISIGLGLILLVMGASFLSTDPEGREIDVLRVC